MEALENAKREDFWPLEEKFIQSPWPKAKTVKTLEPKLEYYAGDNPIYAVCTCQRGRKTSATAI
jgi:hypothetical protein